MTIKEFVETDEKIKKYIEEGRLIIKPASEVSIRLPQKVQKLYDLFENLQKQVEDLQIDK